MTDDLQKAAIKPLSNLSLAPLYAELSERNSKKSDDARVHPLSYLQEGLWYMHHLDDRHIVYNIGHRITINQALDIQVLQSCLTTIVERHQILRSRFTTDSGKVQCSYRSSEPLDLPLVDLTHLDAEAATVALEQHFEVLAQTPFDLAQDLLLRAKVIKLADNDWRLFIGFHHIIYDGWSMKVMFAELAELYRHRLAGDDIALEPLPFQAADFIEWQTQVFESGQLQSQLDYWQQYLDGAPTIFELPYDHPRPRVQKYHSNIFRFNLKAELHHGLKAISRDNGCRLYITLMSAFSLLLHKYTGQQDFLIGSPTANRRHTELSKMMGYFTNPLVYRNRFADNMGFADLLAQTAESYQQAVNHGDVLFNKVVEHLQLKHSAAHAPLVQVIFTYQNMKMGNQAFLDCQYSMLERQTMGSQYDLSLEVAHAKQGDELDCWLQYNPDLFESATIERFSGFFEQLVKELIAKPNLALNDYQIISEKDKHALLFDFNDTQMSVPPTAGFHQLFEAQAEQTPDNLALQYQSQSLSYNQLNIQANQLAHYLRKVGVKADVRVGLCVERSEQMVIAILAILKAGGCYVPLDPEYPASRLEYIVENSNCLLILSESHLLEGLACLSVCKTVDLDNELQQRMIEQCPADNIGVDESGLAAGSLAYLIYTSGSTGKPKGVGVTHGGWINLAFAQQKTFAVDSNTKAIHFASISFDAAAFELSMAICWGAQLHLVPDERRKSPQLLAQLITDNQINLATLPPAIVTHMNVEQLGCLSTLIVAGEAISQESAELWSHGRKFYNAYGPTETTVCATVGQYDHGHPTIGKPLINQCCYVLDGDGFPVAPGVVGHLHVSGAQLARGYIDQPALTAQRFVPNPFANEPGERLYATGDLVRYLPDGRLAFIGRIDHQVKVRGFRIELGEIEALLLKHPNVAEAHVIVRELAGKGEGEGKGKGIAKQLIAYYVPKALENFDDPRLNGKLLDHLHAALPDHMVPSAFVRLPEFVLTPNKKIDRSALPEPDASAYAQASYTPPGSEIEKQLVALWQQNLSLARVGIEDNYFAIGGDSIRSISLVSEAQKVGLQFAVADLFAHTTIKSLAGVVVTGTVDEQSNLLDEFDELDSFSLLSEEEKQSLFNHYDISE